MCEPTIFKEHLESEKEKEFNKEKKVSSMLSPD